MSMMEDIFFSLGRADAADLRARAHGMTGTEIIDEEVKIPLFQQGRDYSACPVGTPVKSDGQIWLLIQPYDTRAHMGKPSAYPNLWGLAHTKNPHRAKPFVRPYGTSGLYRHLECYLHEDGNARRLLAEETGFTADEAPELWEVVVL